jgi:hypothetical protein
LIGITEKEFFSANFLWTSLFQNIKGAREQGCPVVTTTAQAFIHNFISEG